MYGVRLTSYVILIGQFQKGLLIAIESWSHLWDES